jgi:L-amino acid N-acyltransferase YncA
MTFTLPPLAPSLVPSRYQAITAVEEMPYFVAVDSLDEKLVLGYCYAGEFRGNMHAYDHTAELSIFINPEHQKRGCGTMLMEALLDGLRKRNPRGQGDEERVREPVKGEIRNLLAIMSVDGEGWKGGEGLRDWYVRWGFEEKGRMEKVGWKLGRWIDVVILQLKL